MVVGNRRVLKKKTVLLWISGVTAAVVAAGAIFFAVSAINRAGMFAQEIDGECAPLVVLAFRGSGEQNLTPGAATNAGAPYRYGDTNLVTNGWEGITLDGLFEELSETTHEGFRGDSIPVVPIGPAGGEEPFGYDAIDAVLEASSIESALTFSNSRLLYSATRGAEAATHLIHDYLLNSEGCPIAPKFVIVGYSQGAMAARHTAELNPESVLGVLNIGDPYQMPEALGVRSEGAKGIGIIRWKADEIQRGLLDAYYSAFDFTSSICHGGDPICEFSPVEGLWKLATGAYAEHMDYYTDAYPGEAEEDAQAIAKLAHEQWLLAQAAAKAGKSVQWSDDPNENPGLRGVSLSFAGTPTLFSALSPGLIGRDTSFDFDLDGDGEFETPSNDGIAWATFDDDGPRTVGVRVTDNDTGDTEESTTPITVAPHADGEIPLEEPRKTTVRETSNPDEPETSQPTTSQPSTQPSTPPVLAPITPIERAVPPAPAPQPPAPAPTPDPEPEEPGDSGDPGDEDPGDGEPGEDGDPGDDEPPAQVGASVSFSPGPYYTGQTIIVTGTGFHPNSTVNGGLEYGELYATTDDSGNFQTQLWVPEWAPAEETRVFFMQDGDDELEEIYLEYWITVEEQESAPVSASVEFSPGPYYLGYTIIVSASGFHPNTPVNGGLEFSEMYAFTDEFGNFQTQLWVPDDATAGETRVVFMQDGDGDLEEIYEEYWITLEEAPPAQG